MSQSIRIAGLLSLTGLLVLAFILTGPVPVSSQDKNAEKGGTNAKRDLDQSKFMRMKLEASNQILEGLVTEDADLVIKGAKVLTEMSAAEKWQVHNNVMYRQSSKEFQQSAQKLIDAAEKGNFDAITLKWIDTTMKCIECHTFVRGARLASDAR